MKSSNFVCTVGPTNNSPERLERMIYKGMSVARLNMSHGTHEEHEKSIENIRIATERYKGRTNYNPPVAIAVDLRGQEIRLGKIPKQFEASGVQVNVGDKIRFHNNPLIADEPLTDMIFIDHSFIDKTLKRKHEILIDDGKLSFIVDEIYGVNATCKANKIGVLRSFQSVFIPAIINELNLPIVSEKDAMDIEFAVKNSVDFIFTSYVESQEWIDEIRARLGKEGRNIEVFTKIQSFVDDEKLDEILTKADGIILKPSVKIDPKHTKIFEYFVLNKCKIKMKPCFTIFSSPFDQAKICQAVNWKIDNGDGHILTRDAAEGKENPLRSIKILERCRTLKSYSEGDSYDSEITFERNDVSVALASAYVKSSSNTKAAAIIVLGDSKEIFRLIYFHQPTCEVIAVLQNDQDARQLNIFDGITPVVYDKNMINVSRLDFGIQYARQRGVLRNGDTIVVFHTNLSLMEIHYVPYDN